MIELTEIIKLKAVITAVTVLTTFYGFGVKSALGQNIGRSYLLPASITISGISLTPRVEGDLTITTFETFTPANSFDFSILSQENSKLILDSNNSPNVGLFPNAITSFSYIEASKITINETIEDSAGNILVDFRLVSSDIEPVGSIDLFDGNLLVSQGINNDLDVFDSLPNNRGITYKFDFGKNFIDLVLPESSFSLVPGLDPLLAVNDISYIVEQNLFGQQSFVQNLILSNTNLNINTDKFSPFDGENIESTIITTKPVSESSNVLGLLTLGLLSTGFLLKNLSSINTK